MLKKGELYPRRRAYAQRVTSMEDFEAPFAQSLARLIPNPEAIQHMIHAPSWAVPEMGRGVWARFNYMRPVKACPETVLVSTPQQLLAAVLPKKASEPVITPIPLESILSIELGSVLLVSWLTITWSKEGRVETTQVYFNTVHDFLFYELVVCIRRALIERDALPEQYAARNLGELEPLPYKFRNIIAQHLLLPDEGLQGLVFRPAVWRKQLGVFRQLAAPELALMRTNYHVLVMYEQEGASERYGAVFRYCPLSAVQQASIEKLEGAVRLDLVLQRQGAAETLDIQFPLHEEDHLRTVFKDWMA